MPNDVSDTSASTGDPSTMFVPLFAPDEPDNWTATTSNCTTANKCTFACADGGSSCSSTSSTLLFNGAPPGSFSYNNYLPDAGDANTCADTFTVTSAAPAVISKNNHGFVAGDQVVFSTTGALPTGLTKFTRYYVLSAGLTTNSFRVSTTSNGTAVNTSGSQSGTHFIGNAFTCRGTNTPPSTTTSSDQCARTGSTSNTGNTSIPVGRGEQRAFGGRNLLNNVANNQSTLNCKYGTPDNKATVASITDSGLPGGPNFMCTAAPLLPLSTDKTTIKNAINAMVAKGATSIIEGAMWGWRALSPGEPFTQGRPYNTKNNQKILILMTDGQNTYYPLSQEGFLKSMYDVYGYVARGQLGTTSTTQSTLISAMDQRTLQACNNIKAAGIIVYTVAFQIPSDEVGALTLLSNCASDKDKYFAPGSNSELLSAFNAIGRDISELRVCPLELLLLLSFGSGLADRLLRRDLVGDSPEDVRRVAYHERRRAIGRAMQSLPGNAAVHRHEACAGFLDDQLPVGHHLAVDVHDDEVGLAERLAGDHEQLAALHRDVRDRRVSDDDLGGRPVKPNEGRLVDENLNDVACGHCRMAGTQPQMARRRAGDAAALGSTGRPYGSCPLEFVCLFFGPMRRLKR